MSETTRPLAHPTPDSTRSVRRGVLAGSGVLVAIMLLLAGAAIVSGTITQDEAGRVNLEPWLVLQVIGGSIASVLAGATSRRIARSSRGPRILAAGVFAFGLVEAAEILRFTAAGGAEAPTWLVLLAPVMAAAGVLLGGWCSSQSAHASAGPPEGVRPDDARR